MTFHCLLNLDAGFRNVELENRSLTGRAVLSATVAE
jgi:hypothetical protein